MRVGLTYGLGPKDAEGGYEFALAQIDEADRLGLDFALFDFELLGAADVDDDVV